MNRFTKILVALAVLGVGGSASALQLTFNGDFNNRLMLYTDQASMYAGSETIGNLSTTGPSVVQKFPIVESWAEVKYRLGTVVATDDGNVKGVFTAEWGSIRFGNNPALGCTVPGATCTTGGSVNKISGGNFSGDGVNTETRFLYADFQLPTAYKNRLTIGLQPFVGGNKWLWSETATGVQMKGEPEMFGYTLAWMRGLETFNTNRDQVLFGDADNLLGRVELGPKDMKVGAFYLYQHKNPKTAGAQPISHLLKNFGGVNYNLNNLGVDGALKFGPLFANFDLVVQTGKITNTTGSAAATGPNRHLDVNSFFGHADLGVNVGPAKVTYTGWYASGDTNPGDGSVHNFISTDVDVFDSIIFFEGGFTDDNYLTEAPYFLDKGALFNKLAVEFKPLPKLTVGVAGMYVMTAEDLTLAGGTKTKNLGTEFDGVISYKMYDNLELAINAGYLFAGDGMDFFEAVKNGKKDHDIFRSTARARFTF